MDRWSLVLKGLIGFAVLLVLYLLSIGVLVVVSMAHAHEYPVQVKRVIDADTMEVHVLYPSDYKKIRLMCVNAPESRGKDKTPEGVEMSDAVKAMKLNYGSIEVVGVDVFGRLIAYFTPRRSDKTLNLRLFEMGAPLYSGLTKAEREECLRRFKEN